MRRLAVYATMIGLVAGCSSGEEYNTAPPVAVEPQVPPKTPKKPKVIPSASIDSPR